MGCIFDAAHFILIKFMNNDFIQVCTLSISNPQ